MLRGMPVSSLDGGLPPATREEPSRPIGLRWTLTFAALTAALTLALALVLHENRRLRDELVTLAATKARASGLEEGKTLAPFTLRDASGKDVRLDFAGEFLGTVLLFHASGCEACQHSRAFWRTAIEEAARPDVRVLCIQTDVLEGAPLALDGLPASLAVPLPPVGGSRRSRRARDAWRTSTGARARLYGSRRRSGPGAVARDRRTRSHDGRALRR
jgi:hypothetical protein